MHNAMIPWHKRENHIELSARGGTASGFTKRHWSPIERVFPPALAALRRWHPNDPALRLAPTELRRFAEIMFKAGFERGAGWKK